MRWAKLVEFDRGKMEPWVALRNALGVTLPLVAGLGLGMPLGGLAVSSGALQVSYSDGNGPYAERARNMLSASLLCSLAVLTAGLSERNKVATILVVAVWSFAAGLAVSIGPTAESLGVISLVTLIIFAAQPLTVHRALQSSLLALGGGLLQTALALLLWPVRRYEPERRALSELYAGLARAAVVGASAETSPPAGKLSTLARQALAGLGNDNSLEAERYWTLLNQAERIRLSVLTLRRLMRRWERVKKGSGQSAQLQAVQRFLPLSSELLEGIAGTLSRAIGERGADFSTRYGEMLSELAELARSLRSEELEPGSFTAEYPAARALAITKDARFQMDALVGQLRSAARSAGETTPEGVQEMAIRDAVQPWPRRITGNLAILRANLTLKSSAFRHAIRMALCVAAGEAIAHRLRSDRTYWLAMTIVLVLKQDFSATFVRGLLRIGGTILGLLLATGLFLFFPPGVGGTLVLVAVFVFLLRWAGPANYGVFTIAVSALIVVMVAFTGASPRGLILARGEMTCVGGVLALAAYSAWPTWERTQVGPTLAQMLDADREYFHEVAEARAQGNTVNQAELNRTRLEGRLARSNMEASADRLRAEPGTSRHQIEVVTAMVANCHRLVRAVMALESIPANGPPARAKFSAFAEDVETTLRALASELRGQRVDLRGLPDLREDHHQLLASGKDGDRRYALVNEETDRMVNSLNTLSAQVLHWKEFG